MLEGDFVTACRLFVRVTSGSSPECGPPPHPQTALRSSPPARLHAPVAVRSHRGSPFRRLCRLQRPPTCSPAPRSAGGSPHSLGLMRLHDPGSASETLTPASKRQTGTVRCSASRRTPPDPPAPASLKR